MPNDLLFDDLDLRIEPSSSLHGFAADPNTWQTTNCGQTRFCTVTCCTYMCTEYC